MIVVSMRCLGGEKKKKNTTRRLIVFDFTLCLAFEIVPTIVYVILIIVFTVEFDFIDSRQYCRRVGIIVIWWTAKHPGRSNVFGRNSQCNLLGFFFSFYNFSFFGLPASWIFVTTIIMGGDVELAPEITISNRLPRRLFR